MFCITSGELGLENGLAHTLDPESVGVRRVNQSGWVIEGEVQGDYYEWVNEFAAYHSQYGFVWGDYEDRVYATSQDAFDDFKSNHPPHTWDYYDI